MDVDAVNVDQGFSNYVDSPILANLLRWYQAERELSVVLQQFPKMVDLTIDGHSRFVEHVAREARELRTGLKHNERLQLMRVAA